MTASVEGWAALNPSRRSIVRCLAYFKDEVLGQCKSPLTGSIGLFVRPTGRRDGARPGTARVRRPGASDQDAWHHPRYYRGQTGSGNAAQRARSCCNCSSSMRQSTRHVRPRDALRGREPEWLEDYGLVGREIIGRSHYEVIPDIPERWKESASARHDRRGATLRRRPFRSRRRFSAVGPVGDHPLGGPATAPWAASSCSPKTFRTGRRPRSGSPCGERLHGRARSIVITDRTGTILDVNDAFSRITGTRAKRCWERIRGCSKSQPAEQEFYEGIWESLSREGHDGGTLEPNERRGHYAEMLTINAIRNASGEVEQYVGLFSDITEIRSTSRA